MLLEGVSYFVCVRSLWSGSSPSLPLCVRNGELKVHFPEVKLRVRTYERRQPRCPRGNFYFVVVDFLFLVLVV